MFGCSVALLPRCGCCVLCFVVLTLRVRTSLAPRLAGFTVPARSTRDKSHGRTFLTWCSGQYSCPAYGRRIVCRCVPFCFIPGSDVVRSSISFLLLAPDAWARGCGPWFTLPSVACPVGRLHSCCRSVSSL